VINGALTTGAEFARESPFGISPDPDLPTQAADEEGFSRSFINADGWGIQETVNYSDKTGTASSYVVNGFTTAVLANITQDMEDESKPELFRTSSGDTYAFWIREKATTGTSLNNDILFSEWNGTGWNTPAALPVIGNNREVRVIEDANGELLVVFAHADMIGLTTTSPILDAMQAYEATNLCYVRKTDTGWTNQQVLAAIPGTASSLRLHKVDDGSVFVSWLEGDSEVSKLYVQKWDSGNLFWLPARKLSNQVAKSNAALGSIGGSPMAIWSETFDVGGQGFDEDLVERLVFCTLANGSWGTPAPLDITFLTQEASVPSSPISPLSIVPVPDKYTLPQNQVFAEIVNINDLIRIPEGCCDVVKKDIDDIPDIKLPDTFVPDERKWPTAVGSFDPNDQYGLNGHGPEGWISADQVIPYTITFENDPEEGATAPALRVTISDVLDADYDYNTFAFSGFGWGELSKEIPPNTQNFVTDVDFKNADGTPLVVRVSGSFDRMTGEIGVVFDSLDPATGLNPYGAFDGFLQVEDESGNGQGFVNYKVQQNSGLSQGTVFENKAEIVFDVNEPIETPTVIHTIDLEKPTSVASSPATSDSASFTVYLDGSDPEGSGIATYAVYMSVNGGPWKLWINTENPYPVFTGSSGSSYSFYSVASDWAGLKEDKEPLIETTTLVTGSDLLIELMEMADLDTVRVILLVPDGLGATVRAETTDLIDPFQWINIPDIVVTDLGDNRIEILAPFTEQTRQFFRLIAGDGQ
jgi:hypothetical protein